ncbi:MAG: HAMP domain-containing sensor histidine kinase [Archangium sp.]
MGARHLTLFAVLLAVGAVSAISIWDTEQQSRRAVARLGQAQGMLARALGRDLDARLVAAEREGASPGDALEKSVQALANDAATLDAPRQTLVYVSAGGALLGSATATVPRLADLPRAGGEVLELSRDEAEALGLPRRRAVAAWRPSTRAGLGVLVIASAAPERVTAEREEFVNVASIAAISLIVLGLGLIALRRDAERLRLAHTLERQQLERERDEQLARAERIAVASALSLGIAHELATPLSVISLHVEGMRRAVGESQRPALEAIELQIRDMRQVMQGFLSLARGDEPETGRLDAASLARSAAQAVAHRFDAAAVSLDLELSERSPPVRADETLARQALANLLINALQASAAGRHVRLSLKQEGQHVAFRVEDEGAGVDPSISDQVLRPFVTTRRDKGGSGLGLAISQELARHHGGTVELKPRSDRQGTAATLRLPAFHEGTA